MRKVVVLVLSSVCTFPIAANAGGLDFLNRLADMADKADDKNSSGGVTEDALNNFVKEGGEADKLFIKARGGLLSALSSKDDRAKVLNDQKAMNECQQSNDKKNTAECKQLNDSLEARARAATANEQAAENAKKLDQTQKKELAVSGYNMVLASMRMTKQVQIGQTLMQGARTNYFLLPKIFGAKDAMSSLMGNAQSAGQYAVTIPQLFKSADIQIEFPKDAASAPKDTTEFDS